MMTYASIETELDAMDLNLKLNHLAPTCPDTLRCVPFKEEDPLILSTSPNVYFTCNASDYHTKFIEEVEGNRIKLITVPKFTDTKKFVLLDI